MDGSSATWEKTSLGRSLPKKVFVVSLNYFPRCVSHNTACTGDLHCVQLAAAPAPARNAGAVIRRMSQALAQVQLAECVSTKCAENMNHEWKA